MITVILGLLNYNLIRLGMSVNPGAAARCAKRRIDKPSAPDKLQLSRSRIF